MIPWSALSGFLEGEQQNEDADSYDDLYYLSFLLHNYLTEKNCLGTLKFVKLLLI